MSAGVNMSKYHYSCRNNCATSLSRTCRIGYVFLVVAIWIAFIAAVLAKPYRTVAPERPIVFLVTDDRILSVDPTIDTAASRAHDSSRPHNIETALQTSGYRTPAFISSDESDLDNIDRRGRIEEIQGVLSQARCLLGAKTGRWDDATRRAMTVFLAASNSRLPATEPDDFLLNHVRNHPHIRCSHGHDQRLVGSAIAEPAGQQLGPISRPDGMMAIGGPREFIPLPSSTSLGARSSNSKVVQDGHSLSSRQVAPDPRSKQISGGARAKAMTDRALFTHPLGRF